MAYVNWVLLDEQFNLVQNSSSFEQVNTQGVIEPHFRQDLPITQSGYLYIYVSNNTPNIPVYFDNLKVKHTRGALLETNEFYPYGLKMASISYKASMTITNRHGFNGGNEYEDEGELNYSTTFYRKYDAQIGRFTGVDMLAEEFAEINPYQFGYNNPVVFNDPTGAMTATEFYSAVDVLWNSNHGGTYRSGSGTANLFESEAMSFGFAASYMQENNLWGTQPGWAGSFSEGLNRFNSFRDENGANASGRVNVLNTYNYSNKTFSGIIGEKQYSGNRFDYGGEEFGYAGYGDAQDLAGIQAGYAIHQQSLGGKILDATHSTLDIVGLIPVIGEVADGINGGIYALQGDFVNAGISAAAMIPIVGWGATGAKFANKAHIVYHAVDKSGAVKYVGITSRDLVIREAEHKTKDAFKDLRFFEIGRTSTRLDARIMEQSIINKHGLPNLLNKINSIKESNWLFYGIKH